MTDPLEALLDHLAADPHAPTPIRDPDRARDVHVADSLAGLEAPPLRTAHTLADLGSGAGFPGLVLAAARPGAHVVLVESNRRKAEWIEGAARAAGIRNAEVAAVRAEEWDEGLDAFEAVTARALAALPVLVEYAAPLLVLGGHLVAWKGTPDRAEERAGQRAAARLGMEGGEFLAVQPYEGVHDRRLYLYEKVRPTPPGFPRRPGVAARRPLGSDRSPE